MKRFVPDKAFLPTFFVSEESFTQLSWDYLRGLNNDDTLMLLDGNLKRLFEQYIETGFIPEELTRYLIPGSDFVKVK